MSTCSHIMQYILVFVINCCISKCTFGCARIKQAVCRVLIVCLPSKVKLEIQDDTVVVALKVGLHSHQDTACCLVYGNCVACVFGMIILEQVVILWRNKTSCCLQTASWFETVHSTQGTENKNESRPCINSLPDRLYFP